MYDLEQLKKPYKCVYSILRDGESTGAAIITAIFYSIIFWMILTLGLIIIKSFGFQEIGTLQLYQRVNVITAILIVFYPITFTIIYTPIALLLAIPVVLYKHVFKLG